MSLSGFFHSFPGLYVTQAFFHSLVASVVAEIAIKAWDVRNPVVRQRVLLVPVVAPIFLFPLFRLVSPERDSAYFRLETIFEIGRWLEFEALGTRPAMGGLALVFAVTSLVFLFQELIPILGHSFRSGNPGVSPDTVDRMEDPEILSEMESLTVVPPSVFVVEDDDFLIFSTTGKNAAVYVSSSLVKTLTEGELRSAVAHEISHVLRSRHPMLVAAYMLRALMFFNPVVLMEFRRAAQEEEKVCDAFAVKLTRNRGALVDALRKLYLPPEEDAQARRTSRKTAKEIEERSHRLNIESRISRLESGIEEDRGTRWLVPSAVVAAVVAINYFIV